MEAEAVPHVRTLVSEVGGSAPWIPINFPVQWWAFCTPKDRERHQEIGRRNEGPGKWKEGDLIRESGLTNFLVKVTSVFITTWRAHWQAFQKMGGFSEDEGDLFVPKEAILFCIYDQLSWNPFDKRSERFTWLIGGVFHEVLVRWGPKQRVFFFKTSMTRECGGMIWSILET